MSAQFARLFVVLALTVAMAGSGFAHRMAPQDVDDEMLAYLATGGTLAELCGDTEFGSHSFQTCDACRLVDTADVPPSDALFVGCAFAFTNNINFDPQDTVVGAVSDPVRLVRAPPVV